MNWILVGIPSEMKRCPVGAAYAHLFAVMDLKALGRADEADLDRAWRQVGQAKAARQAGEGASR